MPNGLLRVPGIENNKNMNNHLVHDYKRNIFTSNLAPSTGSLTENYLKAKTLYHQFIEITRQLLNMKLLV